MTTAKFLLSLTLTLLIGTAINNSHAFALFSKNEAKSSYTFEQNSKQMYDAILKGVPIFARGKTKINMDTTIPDVCAGRNVVTEEDMYKVVKQCTPKFFLNSSIKTLDKYKSK
mmetsp:Transcript_27321/g.46471  ORF Transcript_27321/g.46471 Transcript_27321/m.46471 type:complete len:113 (-) Transcript_27321:205-543(-)|eukprot:CAMPEP_0183711088 /NCGR_PEP_ID=MMETSP0737-20130205/6673_1 /TAXON_ID=385413 /ORGANISM="Thalassiosira miniscula, Strain CCMP1093" /LENGTH=112 /DNA_ID=CAMNT_0025939505 /DNA_START=166 /DNA_END=504 /DNA_ORIENTATION=-